LKCEGGAREASRKRKMRRQVGRWPSGSVRVRGAVRLH
jgi:hypothetical protein